MMGLETWVLLGTVVLLAWLYSKWRHTYWSSRGVPTPPVTPFLGHYHNEYFIATEVLEYYSENYSKFYKSMMYGMYDFFKPVLVIWDTELLKHIFVKDFDHFANLRDFNMKTGHIRDEMTSEMLSLKTGEDWKNLRAIMTPTFTSGKIKTMFPLVCDKADALVKFSMKQAAENPHINMKTNFGKFTMDTIASCAFGIECNSLLNDNTEFTRCADAIFSPPKSFIFKLLLFQSMPKLFSLLDLSLNVPETDFFIEMAKQTIAARKRGERRGDFLDLLLEARENSDKKHVLSDLGMVSQSVLFIIAGYQTTAVLLSFSSFLLAQHKDQQQRLREEVRQMVKEHGGITYQGIMEAKLLEACLQEALRLYPPAFITERLCTKTFKLQDYNLTLKPGHLVQVPIWSIHHDPRYWRDPEAFIPDRFLPENKSDIQPFTHMPFGMGPRNCIAMRFALMEAKVALVKLLLEAEMEVAPGYEKLKLSSSGGLLVAKEVMLVLKPVKD